MLSPRRRRRSPGRLAVGVVDAHERVGDARRAGRAGGTRGIGAPMPGRTSSCTGTASGTRTRWRSARRAAARPRSYGETGGLVVRVGEGRHGEAGRLEALSLEEQRRLRDEQVHHSRLGVGTVAHRVEHDGPAGAVGEPRDEGLDGAVGAPGHAACACRRRSSTENTPRLNPISPPLFIASHALEMSSSWSSISADRRVPAVLDDLEVRGLAPDLVDELPDLCDGAAVERPGRERQDGFLADLEPPQPAAAIDVEVAVGGLVEHRHPVVRPAEVRRRPLTRGAIASASPTGSPATMATRFRTPEADERPPVDAEVALVILFGEIGHRVDAVLPREAGDA